MARKAKKKAVKEVTTKKTTINKKMLRSILKTCRVLTAEVDKLQKMIKQ